MNTEFPRDESPSIQSRLKRLDTYLVEYGRHSVWLRPDHESETPATYLLSIGGPGLPRIVISPDGVRHMAVEECGVTEDDGQIVFEEPLHIQLPPAGKDNG